MFWCDMNVGGCWNGFLKDGFCEVVVVSGVALGCGQGVAVGLA